MKRVKSILSKWSLSWITWRANRLSTTILKRRVNKAFKEDDEKKTMSSKAITKLIAAVAIGFVTAFGGIKSGHTPGFLAEADASAQTAGFWPTLTHGAVYTRGLVLGPNGQPVFAEFAADGSTIREIGEAAGNLAGAFVMSADTYRAYVSAYNAFLEQNTEAVQGAYILTRDAYIPAEGDPPLHASTKSVLVRDQNLLFESGIDLNSLQDLASEVKSLLLDANGAIIPNGISVNNFGFRATIFSPDAPAEERCKGGNLSNDLRAGRDEEKDTICAPIDGAVITGTDHLTGEAYAVSDDEGKYNLAMYNLPCPGFTYEPEHYVFAQLAYRNFNPKSLSPFRSYYQWLQVWDYCYGLNEILKSSTNLVGQSLYTSIEGILATQTKPLIKADFLIDVMALTGRVAMASSFDPRDAIPTAGATDYVATTPNFVAHAPTNLDLDGDGNPDATELKDYNGDGNLEVGVFLGDKKPGDLDENGQPIPPDLIRLPDTTPDFNDQGLVAHISSEDLAETDLYVYRVSNGQRITERKGIEARNLFDDGTSRFDYSMLIRGRNSSVASAAGDFGAWQTQTNMNPAFFVREADHLRVGESVRVIAVNRRTGYIGTVTTQVQPASEGRIDFPIGEIVMRPPNLKIKAERTYDVEAGLTKDGKDRNYLIGFEGSGLASDKLIAISSEWFDQDGTPLPDDLPGYTGRLAKIVSDKTLGDNLAQFAIRPGSHMQLIRLPDDTALNNDHFYVHVSGEPVEGNPDFQSLGAGQGVLAQRPKHYVPVKVALYNEEETLSRRNDQRAAGGLASDVEPVYSWVYRPEMQFSVFDLASKALQVDNPAGEAERIDLSKDSPDLVPLMMADTDGVELLYDLLDPDYAPLDPFGPNRQLVFSIGAEEARATLTPSGVVLFDNLDHLNQLNAEDLFSIRLYQNSDSANVLWEYEFPFPDIAVDLNRDGKVDFDKEQRSVAAINEGTKEPTDKTTSSIPYRFWVNNDLDVVNESGTPELEQNFTRCYSEPLIGEDGQVQQTCEQWDETPTAELNNTSADHLSFIESERDLEDFAPLAIYLGEEALSQHFEVHLKAVGVGINLFRGVWRDDPPQRAHAYVNDAQTTAYQIAVANRADGHVMTLNSGDEKVLDIEKYINAEGIGRFIFEGIAPSNATCSTNAENCYLSLLLYDKNKPGSALIERKVYLDLHDIKDFYQHITAGPSGVGVPETATSFRAGPIQYSSLNQVHDRLIDIYSGIVPEDTINNHYALFVHGWRMKESEKTGFAETAYKRLYWSGYQGRFGMLTWPTGWFEKPAYLYNLDFAFYTAYLFGNEQNYDESESIARRVGPLLTEWLESLKNSGEYENIHVLAHSMGNVVVSEALRHYTGSTPLISSYTATQAATVAGAYDQGRGNINHRLNNLAAVWNPETECIGAQGVNLSPETSWRCYNINNHFEYDMPPDMYRYELVTQNENGETAVTHGATSDAAMASSNPEGGKSYYAGIRDAAGKITNLWNVEDAALRGWEFNQLTKPDLLGGPTWDYRNDAIDAFRAYALCLSTDPSSCIEPTYGVVTSRFYQGSVILPWGETKPINAETADILSHIVPARTNALGQGSTNGAVKANSPINFGSANQGHSAQFYSTFAERSGYWLNVLNRGFGFLPNDYSKLKP